MFNSYHSRFCYTLLLLAMQLPRQLELLIDKSTSNSCQLGPTMNDEKVSITFLLIPVETLYPSWVAEARSESLKCIRPNCILAWRSSLGPASFGLVSKKIMQAMLFAKVMKTNIYFLKRPLEKAQKLYLQYHIYLKKSFNTDKVSIWSNKSHYWLIRVDKIVQVQLTVHHKGHLNICNWILLKKILSILKL